MSLLKAAHLATYLLGAPGAAGTAAHLLTSKYLNLMNFEGNYFLVKAVTELYDNGIPKIPEHIKSAVDKIVQQLQKPEMKQVAQAAEETSSKPEIFSGKKYWCRYFDYSRGVQNVVMEYDKNCVIYNVFNVQGTEAAKPAAPKPAAVSSENTTASRGKVYDISSINEKEKSIESTKLTKNQDFVKGGFYLLSLDKSKFSRLNTLTHIELTEEGSERMAEQTYQNKIATLQIKAPMRGDIKDLQLSFMDNALPSSVLLLKKIRKDLKDVATAVAAGGSEGGKSNKTYFLSKSGTSSGVSQVSQNSDSANSKLQVLGMWEFPPTLKDKDKLSELDLRLLDKVLWEELEKGSSKTPYMRLGLLGQLLDGILKIANNSHEDYENYYVAKTLSDFWDYKVGEKVQLVETTEIEGAAQASLQLASTSVVSASSSSDKNLAEFEVVSGLLVHLNVPIQCIPDSSSNVGEIVNLTFKRNFAKKPNSVFSERKNPTYCKPPQNGLPPYTMIFLGQTISELDRNSVVQQSK